jgi:hypothetical protein
MLQKSLWVVLASLGLLTIGAPVSAHHSKQFVDTNKLISLDGVVTKVEWKNPHMWVYIDVPDENGKVVNWAIEGPSSTTLLDSGISPQLLKVGRKVTIKANPPRDPNDHRGSWEGLVVDGKNYFARGAAISRDGYRGDLK